MSGLRLVLLDSIRPWGGGEKWVLETARTLAGRGHAVHVAAARGSELAERAREAGLSVHELGGVLGLARLLRQERTEVLVANVGRDVRRGALACLLARVGTRLVQRRGIARPLKRDPLNRWLYGGSRVARVVANCGAIREALLEERWGDAVVTWIRETGTGIDVYTNSSVYSDEDLPADLIGAQLQFAALFRAATAPR